MLLLLLMLVAGRSYMVGDGEHVGEVRIDVGVVARHERRVANDAHHDEQVKVSRQEAARGGDA